jgi:glutamine synthetase
VEELRRDEVVRGALGPIADEFIELKSREWASFHRQVTPWEVEQYLTAF